MRIFDYTIRSLFCSPNMTAPQLLPTYSYWLEMCARPAIRSARIAPNGRSSDNPAAPVALKMRVANARQCS